jgi:hypothetical protein
VKHNVMLTIASLLSILLLTLHITDDIVRGISKAEPSNIALAVLVVLLYGTLVLAERRSGYVIMLLVGLFAAGMPVIHMRGAHYGEIAKSTGGFFFVWTLWALGALGGFTFILSARGLWSLRRGQPSSPRESPRKQLDEPARQKENVGRSRPARHESRCTSNLYSALRVIENAWEHSRQV